MEQTVLVESDAYLVCAGFFSATDNIPFLVDLRDPERLLVFHAGIKDPHLRLFLRAEVS